MSGIPKDPPRNQVILELVVIITLTISLCWVVGHYGCSKNNHNLKNEKSFDEKKIRAILPASVGQ